MIYQLPELCQQMIRAYLKLDFGQERLVPTPYYKNSPPREKRFADPVDAGKGDPHEIIADVHARALMHRAHLDRMSAVEVRNFMVAQKIGVDCSGLAAHVLNAYTEEQFGESLGRSLRPLEHSLWRRMIFRLRPFQNINVLTLTSPENAASIALADLKPGDLIRTRGGKHVLLVTETEREHDRLVSFAYVHSSGQFGDDSGAREGRVTIIDAVQDLAQQEWKEVWSGKIPSRDGWMEEREKNGIFRLKALAPNSKTKDQRPK